MKALQDSIHRLLGRSGLAAALAVKIRNQVNCIIAYHLGETANSRGNGEFALIEHLAPRIKTFADVGANVGEWTGCMLEHAAAKGHLFEPSAQCVERLRERFRGNEIVILETAVSDQSGVAQFAEESGFGEGSSLAEGRSGESGRLREVAVTTLDEAFPDAGFQLDFLKIDTEGYDLKVMRGAKSLLSRTRFLQFEYNSHWVAVGSSLQEAMRFLETLGFSVYLVRSTGLHPIRYEFWGDYFRYSNFFACREQDCEAVRALIRERI